MVAVACVEIRPGAFVSSSIGQGLYSHAFISDSLIVRDAASDCTMVFDGADKQCHVLSAVER
jgi:hypothetical protein